MLVKLGWSLGTFIEIVFVNFDHQCPAVAIKDRQMILFTFHLLHKTGEGNKTNISSLG